MTLFREWGRGRRELLSPKEGRVIQVYDISE
jgi:hypothetical protein